MVLDEATIAAVLVGAGLAALVVGQTALRRRRERRDARAIAEVAERGLHLPPSLHPVIDPDVCIGSLSCLKACPEGDILGIVDGAARLVHATHCVGHGRCAAACPVHAIKLVFGTATRGVDLPEVDGRFESSRPGVHVIGELAGMGLIRNAIEQAAQCAEYLAEGLASRPARDAPAADAVVIGAGPAGVSCALGLRARGLSVRVLERDRLGGAMAHYPRQALVTNGPLELPGAGKLRQRQIGKAALLEYFESALSSAGQRVEEGVEVTGLSGQDGAFRVETRQGSIGARKVVLAVGHRGVPRKLGVPGESLPKVTYSLDDADQYAGARVLVVGGGDAAVEAACALAGRGGEVALSYRGPELSRCRPANRARALELAGAGRLALLPGSSVQRIEERQVMLQRGPEGLTLANDYVIACLGGELPLEFLEKMGVEVRRLFGEERGQARPLDRKLPWTISREELARRRWRRWMGLFGAVVLALLAVLAWHGLDYYPLPRGLRLRSPLHSSLKPASSLGITIGICASAVMLTNFLYALRKRWRALDGLGNLSSWLDLHVFVGVMSPVVIAFHAAFQSNNLMASCTYVSLAIVVSTGLVGRYFYALVPGSQGRAVELAELLGQLERLKEKARPLLAGARAPAALESLFAEASAGPSRAPFAVQLARSLPEAVDFRVRLALALHRLPPAERSALGDALLKLRRLRTQAGLFGGIQRLMRAWRSLHVSLAVLLVVALTAHILLAVYLGYGPGWR